MAEPTGASSVYDLVLEVAQAANIGYYGASGQERVMIPVDEYHFERCLKVVNDGIKRFIHDAPPEGWQWQERDHEQTFGIVQTEGTVDSGDATTLVDDALTAVYTADDEINGYYVYDLTQKIMALVTDYTTLTGTVTVAAWLDYLGNASSLTPAASDSYSITDVKTYAGDKSRYYLPDDFSEVGGDITYVKNSNVGSIKWISENEIRRLQEVTMTSSFPTQAATRSVLNRIWEFVVNPSPTSAKTVTFPYRTGLNKLVGVSGLASSGSTTTLVDSTFANRYPDDYFNGWFIETMDGTGKFAYAVVTDFTGATCTFTVADWLSSFDKSTAAAVDPTADTSYFVTDGIKPAAGVSFDFAVRAAVLAEAADEFGPLSIDYSSLYHDRHLPEAHLKDSRQQPRRRGMMLAGSTRRRTRISQPVDPRRTWTDVSYT